jgi:hypothetical protein
MAVQFKSLRVDFPTHTGSAQSVSWTAVFPSTVHRATAVVNGFAIGFGNKEHPLLQQVVDAGGNLTITSSTVSGQATLGWRDGSGSWDDPVTGWIDVTVIADVG